MERHEVLAALKSLRLHGMASALEEAVSTGIKRNRKKLILFRREIVAMSLLEDVVDD